MYSNAFLIHIWIMDTQILFISSEIWIKSGPILLNAKVNILFLPLVLLFVLWAQSIVKKKKESNWTVYILY